MTVKVISPAIKPRDRSLNVARQLHPFQRGQHRGIKETSADNKDRWWFSECWLQTLITCVNLFIYVKRIYMYIYYTEPWSLLAKPIRTTYGLHLARNPKNGEKNPRFLADKKSQKHVAQPSMSRCTGDVAAKSYHPSVNWTDGKGVEMEKKHGLNKTDLHECWYSFHPPKISIY